MSNDDLNALVARHLDADNGHRLTDTLATRTPDCVCNDVALGVRFDGHAGTAVYHEEASCTRG